MNLHFPSQEMIGSESLLIVTKENKRFFLMKMNKKRELVEENKGSDRACMGLQNTTRNNFHLFFAAVKHAPAFVSHRFHVVLGRQ